MLYYIKTSIRIVSNKCAVETAAFLFILFLFFLGISLGRISLNPIQIIIFFRPKQHVPFKRCMFANTDIATATTSEA
jgi:hypothetical protein